LGRKGSWKKRIVEEWGRIGRGIGRREKEEEKEGNRSEEEEWKID